jgi:hypothetical protein
MIVKRIQGPLLDFWVAKSAGLKPVPERHSQAERHDPESGFWDPRSYQPSTDWAVGGPIVSNEWYVIEDVLTGWFGDDWSTITAIRNEPLKWFMRAYVVSQFGEEVEEVDPSSLVGREVRVIGGDDDSVPPLPVVAGPQRRGGAMGMLGAMLGRRQGRD